MKYVLLFLSPLILLVFMILLRAVIEMCKGRRFPQARPRAARPSILRRLYWDFPKALINDRINSNPDEFREYGVHMICGEQGSGKTVTLAYMLRKYKQEYPDLNIRTNFYYTSQDGELNDWRELVFSNNGAYGQIDVLDEIQNWFNSNQSKDFPPEMLQEVTQQRKQRKIILGTAQVFTRVAKPIREQVNFLYLPMTLFGCLTIVRVYKPSFNDDGTIRQAKMRRCFFFVHDNELRNSFDTYRKIETLSKAGFTPREWSQTVTVDQGVLSAKRGK